MPLLILILMKMSLPTAIHASSGRCSFGRGIGIGIGITIGIAIFIGIGVDLGAGVNVSFGK